MNDKPTFKIVPVEPTEEMESVNAHIYREDDGDPETIASNNASTWDAMLQASPPAPSVEEAKELIIKLRDLLSRLQTESFHRAERWLAQFEAMERA